MLPSKAAVKPPSPHPNPAGAEDCPQRHTMDMGQVGTDIRFGQPRMLVKKAYASRMGPNGLLLV